MNVIVHDSIDGVRSFFEEYAGPFATTEYFEAVGQLSGPVTCPVTADTPAHRGASGGMRSGNASTASA